MPDFNPNPFWSEWPGPPVTEMPVTNGSASATASRALTKNFRRRGLSIVNTGSATLYYADNEADANATDGFPLESDLSQSIDHSGEFWVFSTDGTTYSIVESLGPKASPQ